MSKISKTVAYFKRNGLTNTYYALKERLLESKGVPYNYEKISEEEYLRQKKESEEKKRLISVLVPVYETPERYLRELIDSLIGQSYPTWELVLADASSSNNPFNIISEYKDERIRYVKLSSNDGISENTNAGLFNVTGEYVALLDHDDFLTNDALYEINHCIEESVQKGTKPGLIYSDEDKCNSDGTVFYEPNIKPEFNLDYLLSNNYICHLSVFETSLLKELGFRKEYDGAQDHDVILRAAGRILETVGNAGIVHVSRVLYHWRCHDLSTASNPESKNYAYEAGLRAVSDFSKASAHHTLHKGFYHVDYGKCIFEKRPDIAAVGNFITAKGKITGGIYNSDGTVLYKNMNKHFSGPMHRAHCTMDVDCLDIRNLRPNPRVIDLYSEALYGYQKDYIKSKQDKNFNKLNEQAVIKWSLYFANKVKERGMVLLFDPEYGYETQKSLNNETQDMKQPSLSEGMERIEQYTVPVSVVIPNYNGLHFLKPCIESILSSSVLPREIIIVDNASTDGSREYLAGEGFKDYSNCENSCYIKTVLHSDNHGFTGAVNHGIKVSTQDYVFLLNNDTTIDADCIKNLYEAISSDKHIFSAGALMLSMDKPDIIDNAGDSYNLLGYARATKSGKSGINYPVDKYKNVFTSCAGAAMYSREILDKIGLFDDRHFAYFEDVDLGYRARIFGFKSINVGSSIVYHKGSAVSGSKHNAFKVNLSSQNAVLVVMKNQPLFQLLINLPFLLLGFLVKQGFFILKGLGGVYFKGTLRGLGMSLSRDGYKHHVKFSVKNIVNYIKIELWMIRAFFS